MKPEQRTKPRFVLSWVDVPRSLLAVALLLGLSSCQGASSGVAQFSVSVPPAITTVARVSIAVSAADITTLTTDLVQTGSAWGGVLGEIPIGSNRTFTGTAYDSSGNRLFAGSASGVTISANQTTLVALTLTEPTASTNNNDPPIIDSLVVSSTAVRSGGSITLTAQAHDANSGDTLAYAWSAPSGTFSAATSATSTWTAPSTLGSVTVRLTVTDSSGGASVVSFAVNVVQSTDQGSAQINVSFNRLPRVTATKAEPSQVKVGEASTLTVTASDADNDALQYQWSSSCAGTFNSTTTSSVSFTPSALPAGSCNNCQLTVRVTDARGGVGTATFGLCVSDTPAVRFPPVIIRTYQSSPTAMAGQTVTLEVEASDPQGSALSFAWRANAGALGTATSPSAMSSQITWTAPSCAGTTGIATVTATVTNLFGLNAERNFALTGLSVCNGGLELMAGQPGSQGDVDGRGSNARFSYPTGATFDGNDTLFLGEESGLVRRVSISTGQVTTLTSGLYSPWGLAYDGTGYLYVSERLNQTIRRIDVATGQVVIVAGSLGNVGDSDGVGVNARFNWPLGLAYDRAGILFVVDAFNHTIRRMDVSTGQVTTLAGAPGVSGSTDGIGANARFSAPWALAYDGTGRLFVTDRNNYTVRQVEVATGRVTTLAGTAGQRGSVDGVGANARFGNTDFALAYDSAGGNLYLADPETHRIRRIHVATTLVTTALGQASEGVIRTGPLSESRVNVPSGLATLAGGVIAICDSAEAVVLRATGL